MAMTKKSRDDVLKKTLKTPPQQKSKPVVAKGDGRGAARGLTLDNMEAMSIGLRVASEPIRTAKIKRDTARYEKMREDRTMAKPKGT
jgi:hypothetical protein